VNPAAASDTPSAPRRIGGWALAARVLLISAPPMLLTLWLMVPALHPEPVELSGPATPQQACVGRWCGEVIAVDGRLLACRVDFVGLPADCRLRGPQRPGPPSQALQPQVPVQARAVVLPSLLGLLGLAPTEAVLLRLQQGDRLLLRRSLQSHAWAALYGGWLFHAIYWPLAGLVLALWPGSGAARRLWARLTWTAPATAGPPDFAARRQADRTPRGTPDGERRDDHGA
jgi:hypothetical protein